MPPDEAGLTHLVAGRLRVKLPARRRDAAFFADLSRRLAQCDGVREVHVNPLTGSVLVLHATTPEAIAAYATEHGLFSLQLDPVSSDKTFFARAYALVSDRPARPTRRAGGVPEEERERIRASRLSATLAGLGTLQTVRGQVMAPAITLFWYAYDAWRARSLARLSSSSPIPPKANDDKSRR